MRHTRRPVDEIVTSSSCHLFGRVDAQHNCCCYCRFHHRRRCIVDAADDGDADDSSFFRSDAEFDDAAAAAAVLPLTSAVGTSSTDSAVPPATVTTTSTSTVSGSVSSNNSTCASTSSSTVAAESAYQAAFAERTAEDMAEVVAWWDRYYRRTQAEQGSSSTVPDSSPLQPPDQDQECCLPGNCMATSPFCAIETVFGIQDETVNEDEDVDEDEDEDEDENIEEDVKIPMHPDDEYGARRATTDRETRIEPWKGVVGAASLELFRNDWHWTAQMILLCLRYTEDPEEACSGLWCMVAFCWGVSVLFGAQRKKPPGGG